VLGLRPAPEFEAWLRDMGIFGGDGELKPGRTVPASFARALTQLA
jgi:ethanolamine ammonia-lyase large subunit